MQWEVVHCDVIRVCCVKLNLTAVCALQAEEAMLDLMPALMVDVPEGVSTELVGDYL